MASSVYDLAVNVSTDLASLYTGLNAAADRIGQFGDKVSKQMDSVGRSFDKLNGYLQVLGVSLGAAAFVGGIKSAIDFADRLNDLSKTTGVAVETLGGLGYAAKQSGVDLDTVAKGVQKLAQNMAAAAGGDTQLTDLFARMGVSIKNLDGSLRPLDQTLFDVANKFKSYADGPEKAALATELFKKGGEALIPLLDEGGARLRELVSEYEKYGGVTADTAARADAFNDTLEKVKLINSALFRDIASALLPTLQALANVFVDAKSKGDGFAGTAQFVTTVVKALGVAAVSVVGAFQAVGQSIGTLIGAIIAYFKGDSLTSIWAGLKGGFADAWASVGEAATRAKTIWTADTATIASNTERDMARTVAPIKRVAQAAQETDGALQRLARAQQAYAKAVAESAIALANAGADSATQAIDRQQADLKRQYDRGLVDFKRYYDQQVAYQKQALAVQISAQQTAVDALQAEFVSALNAVASLDPAKFKSATEFQTAQTNAEKTLLEVSTKLSVAQSKLNDTVAKGTEIGKDYVEQAHEANKAIESSVRSIQDQIDQQNIANQTIGLTASQTHLLIAAKLDEKAAYEALHNGSQEYIDDLHKQADAQRELAASMGKGEQIQQALDAIKSLDQKAQQVFSDIFNNGHDAFKHLGDDIKKYLIDLLYQLTVRPFIIQIATSLTGINPANIAGALGNGSGNPLSLLFGGNSGVGGFLSNGAIGIASSGFGQAVGLSTAVGGSAGIAADAVGGIPGGAAADVALTPAGSLFAQAAPFLPLVGLALPLLSGLFSKKPSPVQGQFQISSGTTGFEDNVFTPSAFGNLGFNDANTQQFSGLAAQVFNQIVAGALDAFSSRFSKEQSDHFAEVLKTLTFDTFEGTFTTEDFLQKYGGQVLQQVVTAAFNVLDPALGSVIANFHGTADEIAKFSNSLLAIHDATSKIGSDTFSKNVDAALADATQATADKILALVTVVQQFGDSITGLGPKIEALDPAQMTAFIDALGGAQNAMQAFTYIHDNFTTAAQKASQTQAQLTADFAAIGLAVPKDHAAFLALLDSIDVTTDAGAKLYASIAALAPEFVAVAGTADQAAQALAQAAQTGLDYYTQHFLSPQQQTQQRVSVDETKLYEATKAGTLLNQVLAQFSLDVIPSSVKGVQDLVNATLAKYGADSEEYKQLLAIVPVIGDLIDATGGFGDAAQQAADQIAQATGVIISDVGSIIQQSTDAAKTLLGQFSDLANQSTGDFGEKLSTQIALVNSAVANTGRSQFTSQTAYAVYIGTLKTTANQLTNELARFTVLSAQYDAARAEQLVGLEEWDAQQRQLFNGNSDALAALDKIFHEKWDAIVNGVQTGVDGTLDQLTRLKQGIADYLKGLQVGNLSPLLPRQQLDQAQEAYVEELIKAQGRDQTALGDVTKFFDAYIKQAASYFGIASSQYREIFNAGTQQLGDLAGTLPNGLPTTTTSTDVAGAAIAAVIPTNGRMVSNTDIEGLKDLLKQLITDQTQANAEDVQQQTTQITTTLKTRVTAVPLKS